MATKRYNSLSEIVQDAQEKAPADKPYTFLLKRQPTGQEKAWFQAALKATKTGKVINAKISGLVVKVTVKAKAKKKGGSLLRGLFGR